MSVRARDLHCRKVDTFLRGAPVAPRPTNPIHLTTRHQSQHQASTNPASDQQRRRSEAHSPALPGGTDEDVDQRRGDRGHGRVAGHGGRSSRVDRGRREPVDRAAGRSRGRAGGAGFRWGSGHEPLHGGFVGPGMLSAACPGEVFTSPVPDQMVRAAAAVDSGAGVLFIVKNYTGDVLNFDMAAELAEDEGIQTAKVLVNDDVAVTDSLYTAGRRGTGATLFVEKIAGAAAAEGQPWTGSPRQPGRSTRTRAVSASPSAPAPPRPRAAPPSISRRASWSWASASTASRAASGGR